MTDSNLSLSINDAYPIDVTSLPVGWAVVPLGEAIFDVRPGFASGRHSLDPAAGIAHLRPMNITTAGHLLFGKVLYVPPVNSLRAKWGDVLFNNTNSAELVGKTAPVTLTGEFAFSNHLTRLRPPQGIDYQFVAYQLHYLWETGYFKFLSTQHVNQASVSAKTLTRTVPLLLAPKDEQIRIVAEVSYRLDRLESIQTGLNRARQMLEEYRNHVLLAAVSGTLLDPNDSLPSDNEILEADLPFSLTKNELFHHQITQATPILTEDETALPKSWKWLRVDAVGEVKLGKGLSPKRALGEDMRPYLRVANVLENHIDFSDLKSMPFTAEEFDQYKLRPGDILLNEGQSPELVGRPAIVDELKEDIAFQNHLILFRTYSGISPGYALLVFRHYFRSGRFTKIARWTTNLANLGLNRFASLPFPSPPLAVQERIVAEATQRLNIADEIAQTLSRLAEYILEARRMTLSQAFSGKLVPQDPTEESAADLLSAVHNQLAVSKELVQSVKRSNARLTREKSLPSIQPDIMDFKMKNQSLLLTILTSHNQPMSPEQLFEASGLTEQEVDTFYEQLRDADQKNQIVELRQNNQRLLTVNP